MDTAARLADENVVFLIVPFPLQSHLNQLLHLSTLISSRGFTVHYATSDIHCRQVQLRHDKPINGATNCPIIFHQLFTPPFLSPPPEPYISSVKFLDHLKPSFESPQNLRQPVAALLRELSNEVGTRRLVIIHDSLMNYAVQDAASLPNTESYSFNCGSVFCTFCLTCQFMRRPFPVEMESESIPTLDNCFNLEIIKLFGNYGEFDTNIHGKLFNTCRAMEGPYLDFLVETESVEKDKQWAIAPLFPVISGNEDKPHPTLEWLDKQPTNTVIYVSFGSTTCMSCEQINELAIGLEESKQRFLWVLRDSDRVDIFNADSRILQLPEGFEERVKEVGKVTREWAPQLGILRHQSVGGFMSHCGWNSCLESLTMGVPLATWPMHSDQPHNALLITHILKVGVPVRGWGERDELVSSSAIKKSIESLMESNEGHEIRTRAEELGEVIRQSVDGDRGELNSFLAYATR